MMRSRKGQSLLAELIVWGLSFLIFVFAAPIIFEAIGLGITTGPIGFVTAVTPFIILLLFAGRVYRILTSGGSIL